MRSHHRSPWIPTYREVTARVGAAGKALEQDDKQTMTDARSAHYSKIACNKCCSYHRPINSNSA